MRHRSKARQRSICIRQCFLILYPLLFISSLPGLANAADPALECDRAAERIAAQSTVPRDVLRAITRTETGRGAGDELRPWPWTVNMEGQSIWFDTATQAKTYVFRKFKSGARSFDIGCFQINYRWHGHAFDSIDEMFDPDINARYAANFLRQLHTELGDWTRAAGAYHSRTHKFAARYLNRYTQIKDALTEPPSALQNRPNSFPFLQALPTGVARGSLVPLGASRGHSIFSSSAGG